MFKKIAALNNNIAKYRKVSVKNNKMLYEWFLTNYLYGNLLLEGSSLAKSDVNQFVFTKKLSEGDFFNDYLLIFNQMRILENFEAYKEDFSLDYLLNIYNNCFYGIVELQDLDNLRYKRNLEDLCLWLNKSQNIDVVKLALDFKYAFISLKPFVKYNKLFARLLFNLILLNKNSLPFYLQRRDLSFYRNALTALCEGEKKRYREIMLDLYAKNLAEYLAIISGKKNIKYDKKLLKIGEFANNVGETKATIRYWTKMGILDVEEIVASGYQYYSDEMIDVVNKIQKLKKQRYSLNEIKRKLGHL